jgi:predicted permease
MPTILFSRFLRRARWDDERARELQDYLAHEIDDNLARGMTEDEARRAAHLKLGNRALIREEIYEMNTLRVLDTFWRDLRYGLRLLRRNPGFAAVAIVTLALGTGANAAMFQLVNAVRLRTLPVERPQDLVLVGMDRKGKPRTGRGDSSAIHTEPLWQALRSEQQAFSALFAWGRDTWDLSTEGQVRPAQGLYVSGNFFDALGVLPGAGRMLTGSDDWKGCGASSAIISHAFWHSRYGGTPRIVGRSITLNRQRLTIVGVAPPQFFGVEVGRTFDVAVPMCAEPAIRGADAATGQPQFFWLDIMGRLKPGWTIERADAHLRTISRGIFARTVSPRYNAETARAYASFQFSASAAAKSELRETYSAHIWVLLGATGFVLLITCANLANLMLARATARDREIAVRLAIGASRARIVRQMLSESLLIAGLGAAGGLLLARWLSRSLIVFLSTESNRLFVDLTPDWRVFGFTTLIAVAACLLFGLSPALRATSANPGAAIRSGGRSASDGHEAFAFRRILVVLQVALSVVLIVGALLFARSLRNLSEVDLGFQTEGIVIASIDLRAGGLPAEGLHQAFERITTGARAVAGVRRASEAFVVPLSGSEWNERIVLSGVPQDGLVRFNQVGGEFFATIETPLLEGRTFDGRDRVGTPMTAVVNETFARRYFPGRSPIGRTFHAEGGAGRLQPAYQIVGVVKDTKYLELREPFMPIAYLAFSQEAEPAPFVDLLIRTDVAPGSLEPAITRAIVDAAPGASVSYDSLTGNVRDLLVTERLMASLSGFFGVLALLIATVGLYGVISYAVTRRQVEIGVRLALGAEPRNVVRMVLADSGVLLLAGLAVGVPLAILASRSSSALLYGLEPWDPASFAIAVSALAAVGLLASWIPARRAARLEPTMALRR